MHKVSTVYIESGMNVLDYNMVHKAISNKWEKKARDLQKRRWQAIKKLSKDGKM